MTSAVDASLTEGMAQIAESMEIILAVVAGHRVKLEQAGFSSTVAEQMSAMLYQQLLFKVFA